MDDTLKSKVIAAFNALPEGCRYPCATDDELTAFESEFEPIPDDYRWFLSACGGGTVGSEWVDGIAELPHTHRKFRAESALEDGWTLCGVFVVGWDGFCNPFGIETRTGRVLVEDHNFGGVYELADSFGAFLERGLLS